jgi:hypothetical protein
LSLPFSDDWARSLHGTMEHGVGVLWHAETAVLTAASILAWRRLPKWRPALALAPAASVAVCGILQFTNFSLDGQHVAVYDFKEYLGINALFAAVPLLALGRKWTIASGATVAVAGAVLSGNRSMAVAIAAAAAIAAFVRLRGFSALRTVPNAVTATVAIASLALPLLATPLQKLAVVGAASPLPSPTVSSTAAVDHVSVESKPYGTLWQRATTAKLVALYLASHPLQILTGTGFGAFDEVAETERRAPVGRLATAPAPTASHTYWDGAQKAKFHSHNMVWESLLSGGIPTCLAWLWFVWTCAKRVSPKRPEAGSALAGVVAAGCSLWFLVNAAAPLLAAALASTAPDDQCLDEKPLSTWKTNAATLAMATLMLVFAGAGVVSTAALSGERLERVFIPIIVMGNGAPPCQGYKAVSLPNREINRNLYDLLVRRIVEKDRSAIVEAVPHLGNVANFSCMMRNATTDGDILSLLSSLRARSTLDEILGSGNPITAKTLRGDYAMWQGDLDILLAAAPGRTEMIVPYIHWLNPAIRKQDVSAAVDHFLPKTAENDPVHHWLIGEKAAADGQQDAYRSAMATSLRLGLANLVPVQPEVAASFLNPHE